MKKVGSRRRSETCAGAKTGKCDGTNSVLWIQHAEIGSFREEAKAEPKRETAISESFVLFWQSQLQDCKV